MPAGSRKNRDQDVAANFTDLAKFEEIGSLTERHLTGVLNLCQMSEAPVEKMVRFAMVEGLRLTRSRLAFVAFVGASEELFLVWTNAAGEVKNAGARKLLEFRPVIDRCVAKAVRCRAPFRMDPFFPWSSRATAKPGVFRELTHGICVPVYFKRNLFCVAGVADQEVQFPEAAIPRIAFLMANMGRLVYLRRAEIERERLRTDLAQAREREMEIGFQIQQVLLLGKPPEGIEGAQVEAMTIPSLGVDGDFFDFFVVHPRCFDFLVGDVMGKGVPAALMGAAVKSYFQRALSRLLTPPGGEPFPSPGAIVSLVHAEITSQLAQLDSFVSLHFGRFDLEGRRLELINCGHTRAIHYRRRLGKAVLIEEGGNAPLGILEQEVHQQISLPFEPGDTFLFYSDGVTEARNPAGRFFGIERLLSLVEKHHARRPSQLVAVICSAVARFVGSPLFTDDLTLVAIRIGP